jgi:hypothetical protein
MTVASPPAPKRQRTRPGAADPDTGVFAEYQVVRRKFQGEPDGLREEFTPTASR